jgi:uncharacterized protein (TIGR02271 family)
MSSYNSRTITAFFDSRDEADAAVAELRDAGIDNANISVRAGADSSTATSGTTEHRGFFEALGDLFMPDEDRSTYAEGLRRGGYIVAVTTDGQNDDFVYDILESRGSVDLDERASTWRSEGWEAERSSAISSTGVLNEDVDGTSTLADDGLLGTDSVARDGLAGESDVVPVVEERLRVGKRDVSHGRVRIRSYVSETPVSEQVTLRSENISLERRPVDRPVSDADAAFRDVTLEAQATAEEAVVGKEARVVEEISLRKDEHERVETITDTVRKQEVEVEDTRIDPATRTNR